MRLSLNALSPILTPSATLGPFGPGLGRGIISSRFVLLLSPKAPEGSPPPHDAQNVDPYPRDVPSRMQITFSSAPTSPGGPGCILPHPQAPSGGTDFLRQLRGQISHRVETPISGNIHRTQCRHCDTRNTHVSRSSHRS